MSDERKSGIALIAGSAAMIITMAFHPRGVTSPEEVDSVVRMLIAVHSLALLSAPVIFLGAWGLSRRLNTPDRMAMIALVLYGFALVLVVNAAVLDGLVAPNLIRRIFDETGAARDFWHLAMKFNFEMNQAFARAFAVASSLAVLFWSVGILRRGVLSRVLGIYGCVLAPVAIVAIGSGYLTPNVHGFGMLVALQAIWFVSAGVQLCSLPQPQ
jgi:hypothetical protein